jgi:C4-dicarboxylate transporter DctM subunit
MVVYAAAVDVSVGRMFLAGVIPGLLAGLMLMIGIYVAARVRKLPAQPRASFQEVLASARDAAWGLALIVIILGGIYGGIFTPTEAAAVAAVYAFLIANFVYRDMGPFKGDRPAGNVPQVALRAVSILWHPDTKKSLLEAGKLSIMLMFIIANALILKHVLTEEQIPQSIANAMLSAGFGPVMFLVIVNVILLIGGQFMEPSGLIVIVAPLVFPIAISLGIDPIHLGIIMVVNMEIGMITPPVGLNLFVTSGVAQMPMMRVVKAALPWLAILFVFLIMVTYIPWLSTLLPNSLMGPEIITK